ncbi:MAG: SNF2-related protein [Salinibacter sp.]
MANALNRDLEQFEVVIVELHSAVDVEDPAPYRDRAFRVKHGPGMSAYDAEEWIKGVWVKDGQYGEIQGAEIDAQATEFWQTKIEAVIPSRGSRRRKIVSVPSGTPQTQATTSPAHSEDILQGSRSTETDMDRGRLSPFHLRLIAEELQLQRPAGDKRRLTRSLQSSAVDLQPHQIDAALFAFQSPLSRGALLADEVGLGKTIEAGLVMAQLYAEGRRDILIIVPASLRKQWQNELLEKFDLPTRIIEGRPGQRQNPFRECLDAGNIGICSIHYAYHHADDLEGLRDLDLVAIDEAHHFRNVWKSDNKMGQAIKDAIAEEPKLLLTATPLHNNLLELFGLVSFIDDKLLGTVFSFKAKFMEDSKGLEATNTEELRDRLQAVCKRTLRQQVQEYVPYTDRHGVTETFTPYDDEHRLYELVSAYLQREELVAIPHNQRSLMLLVYRKILASSSFAISGTLERLIHRLQAMLEGAPVDDAGPDQLDVDGFAEEREELAEANQTGDSEVPFTKAEIQAELDELRGYHELARSITRNSKGEALLQALQRRFEINRDNGWPERAVVFTESRRTQQYLLELLEANGYANDVTIFSGQNDKHKRIAARAHERWIQDVPEDRRERLSKEAGLREALIHEFREHTKVLIATEAGAEGINLQFCNTVVNYDLPWNPQRVEQRIGRCHRYGQAHDVVVLNFVNDRNAADRRVFELLDQKFKLFKGVFGASDEVLGAIGSGVDFEKRILEIYQQCRTPEEIDRAFKELQAELEEDIQDRMAETRRQILENFDEDVQQRLKLQREETENQLNWIDRQTLRLLHGYFGSDQVAIDEEHETVDVEASPEILLKLPRGTRTRKLRYGTAARSAAAYERVHLGHPLIEAVIKEISKQPSDEVAPVELLYTEGQHKISMVEPYLGHEGLWFCYRLTFKGLKNMGEEHLAHIVYVQHPSEGWKRLSPEVSTRFPSLTARPRSQPALSVPAEVKQDRKAALDEWVASLQGDIEERNLKAIDEEYEKLERYTEEALMALEGELEKYEAAKRDLRQRINRTQDYRTRLELRQQVNDYDEQRERTWKKIEKERERLHQEKNERIRELEQQAELKIEKTPVGVCHWVMS